MKTAIELPRVLAIGFTGHRNIPHEDQSRQLIRDFLAKRKEMTSASVYGVSSVAAGGDLLFAESCVALGIPLRVLLPLPVNQFCTDFDPPTWSRAEQVMKEAISIEVVGEGDVRSERYYACGLETVQQSELLLALWNGQPADGLGGTEEIVTFAKQLGRCVNWINSSDGTIQTFNQDALQEKGFDPELKFLNGLAPCGAEAESDSPLALGEAWLEKLDANAVLVAPQVRRMAAFPIVLTALAAFVSGDAPRLGYRETWVLAGAILGLAAAFLPAALRLSSRQALWVRIRTAAEVSRSFLALWELPTRYQIVGPEMLPELRAMLLSLNLLKAEAKVTNSDSVIEFRDHYLQTRLVHQMNYFLYQSNEASKKAHRFRLLSKICIVLALLLSAWSFVQGFFGKTHSTSMREIWLSFTASALFQIATIATALLVVYDCDRRDRRYQEIYHSLFLWEKELRALYAWHPVIQVVSRVERALLVELIEWRSLLQNMKMPRD
jgi:hypothetical protein